MVQDISLSDKTTRNNLLQYWEDGDMTSIATIVAANPTKAMSASVLNALTTSINALENSSIFLKEKIKVASIPPVLTSNQVYFQVED